MGQACTWLEQLLPTADSLDPQARGELVWTALVAAVEVGDDAAALSAREHLAPLLAGIADPFLQAVSRLALAWTSPLVGDFAGALREASVGLEQLRGQDEPFWTALAVGSLGSVEMAVARHDDALAHLREACDQAERFGNAWLAAWSRGQLGILAIMRGRPEEAGTLLDGALRLSLAAHSTRSASLCLPRSPGWRSSRVMPSGPRCWQERPRACAGGPASRCGQRCDGSGTNWWPRSARRWGRNASTRCSPTAPGSTSGRRWPPSATAAAPAPKPPEPWPRPRFVRTPYFPPQSPHGPAQTLVRTAVGWRLLVRRRSPGLSQRPHRVTGHLSKTRRLRPVLVLGHAPPELVRLVGYLQSIARVPPMSIARCGSQGSGTLVNGEDG